MNSLLNCRVKIRTAASAFFGLRGTVIEENQRIDSCMIRFSEEELRRAVDFDRVKEALRRPVHFIRKELALLVPKPKP